MNSFRFIFFRLCLYLILGLLAGFYISAGNILSLFFIGVCLAFFIAAYLIARKQIFYGSLPGVATFLLVFSVGYGSAHFSQPQFQPSHYLKFEESTGDILLKAHISEELKTTSFGRRYILEADELVLPHSTQKTHGKILLNLPESFELASLTPGMQLLIPFEPKEIRPPLNPFQFSYKDYLSRMKIERQLNLTGAQVKKLNSHSFSLKQQAEKIRMRIINKLRHQDFSASELAVFQALILGERREISDEMYKNYAAAGAIHILAISGLHIGILLWLLNFLFKPLENIRQGKILKTTVIILLLWCFAFITGLSPSVLRAVCMFSFIAVGMQLNRKTSTLNSIFVSLFFLLLINPYYIFQVGFQLSYLAVTGIVIFYPIIYKLFEIRQKWLDYFWKLISVSISAQIAILPLSLFYFHQFPGLFLLTNLVILPILAFILCFGILIILLAIFDILPGFMAEVFGSILSGMNAFVEKVAGFENFVFTDIRFSAFQVLTYFFVLTALLLFFYRKAFGNILFLLISVLIFQLITFAEIKTVPSEEFIVFQKNRGSIIAEKRGDLLIFHGNKKEPIKDYLRERSIKNVKFEKFPSAVQFSGKRILIVDSMGIYKIPELSSEIVILKDSPKINLERLINSLKPQEIVADNSNSPWLVKKWRNTCKNEKIPFHYTGEKGAYILNSR